MNQSQENIGHFHASVVQPRDFSPQLSQYFQIYTTLFYTAGRTKHENINR